ncbi:TIGR03084 family metal-binding protein [Streptomyces sp. A1277]|uniref:TIGR03084 family metal-binding protein n=1 Tax=Streptomyces sp. A1277 TaxID=2563103 RepID=UPI001447F1E8|nr:TIGR03084 family metal-binding protein [Streptomyces sp. A1277]
MTKSPDIYADLVAEGEEIDALLDGLDEQQWQSPTPAPGWTVAHQVAHLAFVCHLAATSARDPQRFAEYATQAKNGFQAAVDAALAQFLAAGPQAARARWREELAASVAGLAAVDQKDTVPWLVNPLPPTVLAAAGMMEVFAHGQDIADALGVRRVYTDRVGHLAWFGVHTRDFGYQAHGLVPPSEEFRFELTAPSGATTWTFGPQDAVDRITGPAADFALLVSRRRHHADLAVRAEGARAEQWLGIAQAYRGPGGAGRKPGQFAR